jgi:murein DD-endopeptidase MepM/ murein hydrolase activator NlpD
LKTYKQVFIFIALLFFTFPVGIVKAQTNVDPPIYIVQSGDTLTTISARFGVSINDLINSNGISNPNDLRVGDKLVIPGIEGLSGLLSAETVPLGGSLRGISLKYRMDKNLISRVNHITSPSEIFAGSSLILPAFDIKKLPRSIPPLSANLSPLELAISQNVNPWSILTDNQEEQAWRILPGEMLVSSVAAKEYIGIAPGILSLTVTPLPLEQGKTVVIRIKTSASVKPIGTLAGYSLNFFPDGENQYVALQGIHSMAAVGLAKLTLHADQGSGSLFDVDQSLLLKAGDFYKDPPLSVDPETIDPAITQPEDNKIAALIKPISNIKLWTGKFKYPVDEPICIKSWYGNRRSYNGSAYTYFHSGTDFGPCATLSIYAVAPGKVVFTGTLNVRGNAVIIDHGFGVYSGYYHQAEIKVKTGDMVKTGQLIGIIGQTGRVTGPHLHLDVWVNGIQVDPLDWFENSYP